MTVSRADFCNEDSIENVLPWFLFQLSEPIPGPWLMSLSLQSQNKQGVLLCITLILSLPLSPFLQMGEGVGPDCTKDWLRRRFTEDMRKSRARGISKGPGWKKSWSGGGGI